MTSYLKLLTIVALAVSCTGQSGIKRIWAVDDSEKIRKDDISNPLATDPDNAVWANGTINLFGARNEIVAFQLIIEGDNKGASQVNVSVSDLVNGESVIPGSASGPSDPFDYRGRFVELFTEHYLNMEKRSPPLWFFSETALPSAYHTGWVPDCLIPFSAAPGNGGAPFSIEAGKNQGVWVDILIPEDATAGDYSGMAIISVAESVFKKIPIYIKVYDFTLPDSTHISNMFGYYPRFIAQRHGVESDSEAYYALDLKYQQMAHRHRFDLVTGVDNLDDLNSYYNGYRPGMGAVVSDADAVEFRVMPWIVWKYDIDQYFYWSTTFWTNLNVFVNPLTYEDRINGDGTFLYPGQDNLFPEESRNLEGPLSSIRAKNWRRGAQDFEYLWLAKIMSLEAEVQTIVNNCIPTAVWEAKDQNDISWSDRGFKFEEYRKQLAELISSAPEKK